MLGFVLFMDNKLPKINFSDGVVHIVKNMAEEITDKKKIKNTPNAGNCEQEEENTVPVITEILRCGILVITGLENCSNSNCEN